MIVKLFIAFICIITFSFANDKPDFSFIDTNGVTHTKKSTDNKFLIINFWATWCLPCIKEMPELVDFYEKYKDKAQVLGLNHEEISAQDSKDFTDRFMIEYPIISLKNQRQEFEKFVIKYLPTTFIYDESGKLIIEHNGKLTADWLAEIMKLKK